MKLKANIRVSTPMKPNESTLIYEMRDSTEDETFYPLGLWLNLHDAISALDECLKPDDLGSGGYLDDYAKVEILEHKIGWTHHGKLVHIREWVLKYNEEKDEYNWVVSVKELPKPVHVLQ